MDEDRVAQLKDQLDELIETYPELKKLGGRVKLLEYMDQRGINDFETALKSMSGGYKKGETQEMFDAMDRILARGEDRPEEPTREPFITPDMNSEQKRDAFYTKMDSILGAEEKAAKPPAKEEMAELPKFGVAE